MEGTLFGSPDEPPEHAVIARFQLGGDNFGEPDQRPLVFGAERSGGAAVAAAGVGEGGGNEFGGEEVAICAHGPDAMAPGLRLHPFRPAHVMLRFGEPGDDVVSDRVEL